MVGEREGWMDGWFDGLVEGWHLYSLLIEIRIEHSFIQGKKVMKGFVSKKKLNNSLRACIQPHLWRKSRK